MSFMILLSYPQNDEYLIRQKQEMKSNVLVSHGLWATKFHIFLNEDGSIKAWHPAEVKNSVGKGDLGGRLHGYLNHDLAAA